MNKFLKVAASVLLVSLLAFTSACAQLPKSSDIKTGPNVEAGLETDYLYYSPSGPTDGDSQEQILLGFLNAGTGPQNDYQVAREYLAEKFNTQWRPNQEVLVQDGRPTVTLTANNSATVIVPISATINERGQYQSVPAGTTRTIEVGFEKLGDNWRINNAPNLTMVIRPVFDVVFKAYAVYFLDNQLKHLVPDVRWFPSRASTSTRLVNALIGGPSEWMQPAVKTAIPVGTRLTLSSVTVANGIASVDLSSRALRASELNKKLLQVQIRETLLQLNSVYSVQVTIERGTLATPSWGYAGTQLQTTSPVALFSDGLVHVGTTPESKIEAPSSLIEELGATNFGINVDEKILALSSPSGIYYSRIDRPTDDPIKLVSGQGYLAPVVDVDGYTWIIPSSGSRPVIVFDPKGVRINFQSGWLSGADRLSFAISSEGSRFVVVTGTHSLSQVRVAAIIRDDAGSPVGVGAPLSPVTSSATYSATWLDNIRIGVLETQASDYVQPIVSMIGGDNRSLPTFTSGTHIVGSGQASSVFVLDSLGSLFQFRGSSWMKVREGVAALRYPGN